MDFKGLSNGTNFILIDHYVGELLSINKVSSEREHTIVLHCQTGLHIISNGRSESLFAANAIATRGCMMLEGSEG